MSMALPGRPMNGCDEMMWSKVNTGIAGVRQRVRGASQPTSAEAPSAIVASAAPRPRADSLHCFLPVPRVDRASQIGRSGQFRRTYGTCGHTW